MIGEFDIYGVYVPLLAVFGGVAFLLQLAAKRAFDVFGIYRFVWHRPLFDLSIFVILLGTVTSIGIALGAV